MPKGKYPRKKTRMQVTEGAVTATASPPETPEAPSAAPDMVEQVRNLLMGLSAQIQALDEKVSAQDVRIEAVENTGPRFVPSTPETYSADHDRYQIADQAPA